MKSSRYSLIILLITFFFLGCGQMKYSDNEENNKFDMKKAEDKVDEYMRASMAEDYVHMQKCLTKDIMVSPDTMKSDTRVVGYNIEESMLAGEKGIFSINVSSMSKTKVSSELDVYNIKVIMEDDSEYIISEIKSTAQKEAYYENYGLRLRNKNNASTDLLIDFDSIPTYAYSKDDKAQMDKIIVPRSNFGIISFGYSGDVIAVSTFEKIFFYGVVKIGNDSISTANGQSSKDDGSGQGSSSQNGGTMSTIREKPIGKEVQSIDVLKDGKINLMTFSPDEKFLLIQYTNDAGSSCMKMYNVEKGDLIPFTFSNSFDPSNTNLIFNYFDNDSLIYKVQIKDKAKAQNTDIEGVWKLDLKEFKTQKI